MNIPAPENRGSWDGPQSADDDIIENHPNNFDWILFIYGDHIQNKTAFVVSSGK
jgi:hypothetical protein